MLHDSGGAAVLSPGAAAPCLHLSRPRAGFLVSGRAVRLFGLAALPGAPGLEVRHCWPGRCRAGRGRGPASWCGCPRCPGGCPRCPSGCPRSVPDGLNSCDRLRTHADLPPLPPLPKHPEKASRVFFTSRCGRCWPGRCRAGRGRGPASWCRVSGRVRALPVTCWPGRTNHEESGSSNHKKHCKSITYALNKVDPGTIQGSVIARKRSRHHQKALENQRSRAFSLPACARICSLPTAPRLR